MELTISRFSWIYFDNIFMNINIFMNMSLIIPLLAKIIFLRTLPCLCLSASLSACYILLTQSFTLLKLEDSEWVPAMLQLGFCLHEITELSLASGYSSKNENIAFALDPNKVVWETKQDDNWESNLWTLKHLWNESYVYIRDIIQHKKVLFYR